MSFFVFLIIFFLLRRATPRDQRRSDLIKWLIGIYIIMAVLSALLPYLTSFAGIALIAAGIYWLVRRNQQKQRQQQNQAQQDYNDAHVYSEPTPQYRDAATSPDVRTKSTILPRKSNRRLKLLKSFNNKFDLRLTEPQMDCIVNASYMSETWKREMEAMTFKYDNLHQWFQGDTAFLRVYLYAFRVQEVTSDIFQQEQICENAFEQVWAYSDSLTNLSLEERIQRVNDTYYTQFDNVTFMIAYRFLEAHGRKHIIPSIRPVHGDDDLEDLKRKYDGGRTAQMQ